MDSKSVLLVVLVVLFLYLWMGGIAADAPVSSSVDCVTAIEQRYSPVWADLNKVQRFAIGMRAATCEGGGQ